MAVRLRDPPLVEGVDYIFKCKPFGAMAKSLLAGDSACDAALGAITLTREREEAGILVGAAGGRAHIGGGPIRTASGSSQI